MERYADRVNDGVRAEGSFAVQQLAMQRDRTGWKRHADRLIRYQIQAGRQSGDLFHIVDHGFAHLARWLPGDRTIVTCHDLMALRSVQGETGMQPRGITVARFRWTIAHMRHVAHVACDSEATRQDVLEFVRVDEQRTSVIPLGVDRTFRPLRADDRDRIRRDLGLSDRVVIGSVSTGAEYKNPEGALRTLRVLLDRGVPAVLLRTGRGFDAQHRALQTELGLDNSVIERGIVSELELVETYNACDAVLHPSFWEGYGWPPLEAMSCGVPVVTSLAPSLLEVVGDAGLSAPASDPEGLASRVQDALVPAIRAKLRTAGLARADELRWGQTITSLLDVYATVRERANSSPAGSFFTPRSKRIPLPPEENDR